MRVADETSRRPPSVSVIINTDGRAASLQRTLESLRHLDHPRFEVVVVHGPTRDGTKEVAESWGDEIKVAPCPTRNLSQSRNIGVALSAGEILAFLDDDSIPEPEWLTAVTRPFEAPEVAACGGFLLNHTGVGYQWRFGSADRLGNADQAWDRAAPELNFPLTANFPHVMANSAFRKSAVLSVGGFDEQYAYYLDETDLICRLVDDGWRIVQLEGACVHHKYQPSHIRGEGNVYKSWFAIIKSKIYFGLVNSRGHHTMSEVIAGAQGLVDYFRANLEGGIASGAASPEDRARFEREVDQAWRAGLTEGLAGNRRFMDVEALGGSSGTFQGFRVLEPDGGRRTVCMLTQTYPPASIGGIGRYVHQLARSMASRGHQVHVLTRAVAHDTVDLEDGVWVHRIAPKYHRRTPPAGALAVPQHIWDHAATMLDEALRIAEDRPVHAVYAPIWDCEGLAILLDGRLPLVTSLQTSLRFWLESHPHVAEDAAFVSGFAEPMLEAERLLLLRSVGVHAISAAIASEIARAYDVELEPPRLGVVPLGQEDWSLVPNEPPDPLPPGSVRVLFVGRLEERKGIDVLLPVLGRLLRRHRHLCADVVGNNTLLGAEGVTYEARFAALLSDLVQEGRLVFHGELPEARLRGCYAACDVFVAPSRFESFGLILLEAMMFSKPVVACRAGGMVEVVEDGVTGLLAEPGDETSLETCIERLVTDADLRGRMGVAARARYEARFTPGRMTDGFLELLESLLDHGAPGSPVGSRPALLPPIAA